MNLSNRKQLRSNIINRRHTKQGKLNLRFKAIFIDEVQIFDGKSKSTPFSDIALQFEKIITQINAIPKSNMDAEDIVTIEDVINECFWEVVNKQTLIQTKTQWKIYIPKNQTITSSCDKLREIAQNMSEYEHRRASLSFAREWMVEAKKQGHLILEVGEWVNKTSGKGDFVLKTFDGTGTEITLFNRTLWGFGSRPYSDVIQEMFPWADIVIDKDYYAENMDHDISCWDHFDEDDAIIAPEVHVESESIYPYCICAGEVAWYRLLLTLNHIGQAFLTTEGFLENGNLYTIDHLS